MNRIIKSIFTINNVLIILLMILYPKSSVFSQDTDKKPIYIDHTQSFETRVA